MPTPATNFIPYSIVPSFKGGISESAYDPVELGTFTSARGMDVYGSSFVLKPLKAIESQTFNSTITFNTNKIERVFGASNGSTYIFGNDGSDKLRIFKAANIRVGTSSSIVATSSTASSAFDVAGNRGRHWIVEAGGYIVFYNGINVARLKLSDDSVTYDPFSFSANQYVGPILYHEAYGAVFVAAGNDYGANKVYRKYSVDLSGSAAFELMLTLDPKYWIRSMQAYGKYVLIGASHIGEAQTSKLFVWNGSATTVEDVVDVGDVGLQSIRNINGLVHILTVTRPDGMGQNACRLYLWGGGQVELAHELPLNNTNTASPAVTGHPFIMDTAVDVYKSQLYWAFSDDSVTNSGQIGIDPVVYSYGSNSPRDKRFLTQSYIPAVDATEHEFRSIQWVNGNLVLCHRDKGAGNWYIGSSATATLGTLTSQGYFESVQIKLHPLTKGKVKRIVLTHKPLPASTGFVVKLKHIGNYPHGTSVPSPQAYQTLKTQTDDNATITVIEDPGGTFQWCDSVQLKLEPSTVSGTNAPEIIFPIIIETEYQGTI